MKCAKCSEEAIFECINCNQCWCDDCDNKIHECHGTTNLRIIKRTIISPEIKVCKNCSGKLIKKKNYDYCPKCKKVL